MLPNPILDSQWRQIIWTVVRCKNTEHSQNLPSQNKVSFTGLNPKTMAPSQGLIPTSTPWLSPWVTPEKESVWPPSRCLVTEPELCRERVNNRERVPSIKLSLENLRYYLIGREFDLETDHRVTPVQGPMVSLQVKFPSNQEISQGIFSRDNLSLQPFRFMLYHIPGRKNVVADYLSCFPDT